MEMMDATVAEWCVEDGQFCDEGSVIVLLDTDKVTHEVEAPASGYIRILREEGALCDVGDVIAVVVETREELALLAPPPGTVQNTTAVAESSEQEQEPSSPDPKSGAVITTPTRVLASPAARAKARSHGIDLSSVAGTGSNGLISAEDVDAVLDSPAAEEPVPPPLGGRTVRSRVPLSGIRRVIADRLVASLQTSAQVTSWFTVDASALRAYRGGFLEEERPSYSAILTAALGRTLPNHPTVNSAIHEDSVLIWDCVNVGVAVAVTRPGDLSDGLVVPVVRDADTKSLEEIAAEIATKVSQAREGTLLVDGMHGGTFTLSSVGSVPGVKWDGGTPILNGDESGILWAGAIRETPVVSGGQVVAGLTLPIALTHDHRIVDGMTAARFVGDLTLLLESSDALAQLGNAPLSGSGKSDGSTAE